MLITCHPNDNIEYDAKHFTSIACLLILNENPDEWLPAMGNGREGEVQEGDIRPP